MTDTGFKIKHLHFKHRLVLAPMCGITLLPFRKVCKTLGADLVFNQMVSAKALTLNDIKTKKLLEFEPSERPIGLQVFGNNAHDLALACQKLNELNPDIIDLNLGCPAKKIVGGGGGSALLRDLKLLKEILLAMRKEISGIFTIKFRAGYDHNDLKLFDVAQLATDCGVDALALHARTKEQGYKGKADWNLISELKQKTKLPVIGNGDITTAESAREMLRQTGCDAVMTGRGAFCAPWIFKEFTLPQISVISPQDRYQILMAQYLEFINYFGEASGLKLMRKFVCAQTMGLKDSAEFRNNLMQSNHWESVLKNMQNFFKVQTNN